MISQAELDRALAGWKARTGQGGASTGEAIDEVEAVEVQAGQVFESIPDDRTPMPTDG
jgi:hypothetical protein